MKPNTKSLTELLDHIGDIAHEHYLGTGKRNGDDWEYCYDTEVVFMLHDERVKAAILQWVSETVVGDDEPYREPEDLEKYNNSEAYRNQCDHHNEVQAGRRLLRAEQREILRKEGLKDATE